MFFCSCCLLEFQLQPESSLGNLLFRFLILSMGELYEPKNIFKSRARTGRAGRN
jgi:hypothetical protein